jgi:amino acid permease
MHQFHGLILLCVIDVLIGKTNKNCQRPDVKKGLKSPFLLTIQNAYFAASAILLNASTRCLPVLAKSIPLSTII